MDLALPLAEIRRGVSMRGQRYFFLTGLAICNRFPFHSVNPWFIVPNYFEPTMLFLMLFYVIEAIKTFFNKLRNDISVNLLAFVYCINTGVCCRLQYCFCPYSSSLCRCLLSMCAGAMNLAVRGWRFWRMSPDPEYVHFVMMSLPNEYMLACIMAVTSI